MENQPKKEFKNYLLCIIAGLALGFFLGIYRHSLDLSSLMELSGWPIKAEKAITPIPGRWNTISNNNRVHRIDDDQANKIQDLLPLGYLSGSQPAPDRENVTIYDADRAYNGLNLIVSGHGMEAILIDMEGNELHKWSYDMSRLWPDYKPPELHLRGHTFWRRAHLMENGDLFAIFDGIGLIKLDKDSNLIWSLKNGAHHDLHIAAGGHIYLLTRDTHIKQSYNPKKEITEDFISVLDPNGRQLKKISVLDALFNSSYAPLTRRLRWWGDILHTNSIELIEDNRSEMPAVFSKGRVLLSIRNLDLVCLMDLETESIVWGESGFWGFQHKPTLLESGNIMVFDNLGLGKRSRIIEFDPVTREIDWQYGGVENEHFYSRTCGLAQRLQNGNTLITESDPGRAFEITPDKKIVWEFLNPHRAGENDELIATLVEVIRLGPDFTMSWLK